MFGNRRPPMRAPVEVGEELDVRIEAVGEKGDGIAKKSGFVLFVANTKVGDTVRIRVNKVFKKVAFADVIGEASGPIPESSPAPSRGDQEVSVQPEPDEEREEDSDSFGEESEETDSADEEEYSQDSEDEEEEKNE
ncbi:hypothetical protein COV93_02710 [Candidatus Woesearchaeota archaeon CG11_big_fil_rev_8_21_14_0_20_43_8]|nr:MAG: hypothetical protein COV93_02710 [Candidatus Woesearchaeota archaeon CG11_big_fil_rev_8_21_14_0_20_43_8]